MKALHAVPAIACATLLLGACGSNASPSPSPSPSASAAAPMGPMASSQSGATPMAGTATGQPSDKTGKGTGVVTAIDKAAGTVTIQHGAIPGVGWPAMTMAFQASPELQQKAKAGDKVSFEISVGKESRLLGIDVQH